MMSKSRPEESTIVASSPISCRKFVIKGGKYGHVKFVSEDSFAATTKGDYFKIINSGGEILYELQIPIVNLKEYVVLNDRQIVIL